MVQFRKKKKDKQEVEIERKLRIRRARDSMEKFSKRCGKLRQSYMDQAVEAKKIGNEAMVKRFAARLVNLDTQHRRAKSFVLMMNDMELNLEQLDSLSEMTGAMKDFVNIFEGTKIDYQSIAKIKVDMENAQMNSEKLSEALDNVLEEVGDSLTSYGNIDSGALDSMVAKITDQAASSERDSIKEPVSQGRENTQFEELDRKIDESIEEINRESGKK